MQKYILTLASTQSKIATLLLRLLKKKSFLRRQLAANKFDRFNCPKPPKTVLQSCDVHEFFVSEKPVFRLKPKEGSKLPRHVLYLHGGAYVQGFTAFHWKFLAHLVKTTGCIITAPDYPLAPEHTYRQAFDMVLALYRQMMNEVGGIILMGDSAGGGFALALAQQAREESLPQPRDIILLSPWLDITLDNPEISALEAEDHFLEKESLQQAGKLYAGDRDPDHYLLSPIYGSMEGLGRISLFIGTREMLLPDARKLKKLVQSKGMDINYYEYPDMFHDWMILDLPESKKARDEISKLIMK